MTADSMSRRVFYMHTEIVSILETLLRFVFSSVVYFIPISRPGLQPLGIDQHVNHFRIPHRTTQSRPIVSFYFIVFYIHFVVITSFMVLLVHSYSLLCLLAHLPHQSTCTYTRPPFSSVVHIFCYMCVFMCRLASLISSLMHRTLFTL